MMVTTLWFWLLQGCFPTVLSLILIYGLKLIQHLVTNANSRQIEEYNMLLTKILTEEDNLNLNFQFSFIEQLSWCLLPYSAIHSLGSGIEMQYWGNYFSKNSNGHYCFSKDLLWFSIFRAYKLLKMIQYINLIHYWEVVLMGAKFNFPWF